MESSQFRHAGFWLRFAAFLIDYIIISTVAFILFIPFFIFAIIGSEFKPEDETFVLIGLAGYLFVSFLIMIGTWFYYALMESSRRGGTLGKLAVGIRVTDMNGNRISFARASGRYFGKIVSSIILYIGYIMAGFTDKKQALHDIIAGCLVIKN